MVNRWWCVQPVLVALLRLSVEELAQLGVRTFLRIGTTGAIQPHINVGMYLSQRGLFVLMVQAAILPQLNIQQWQILNVPQHFSMRLKKKVLSHL